jgi:ribosomal protein S18 acetylase RimI-like enzyme
LRPSQCGLSQRLRGSRVRSDAHVVGLIREAGQQDAARLLTFCCANSGESWTKEAEDLIREDIADAVRDGNPDITVHVALSDTGIMVGVIAASLPLDGIIEIYVLAVVRSFRRRGIGTDLKQHVMRQAGQVRIVKSEVHRKNVAMKELNAKLNAVTAKHPEDGKYLVSVVRLSEP